MSAMFSNGTEGEAWMSVWCYVCKHEETCEALDDIFMGGTPDCITLEKDTRHLPALHVCSRYEHVWGEDEYADIRARVIAKTTGQR